MEEKIQLVTFDKNNKEHIRYLKKILHDKSILKRFQGILPYLLRDRDDIFNRGFFLSYKDELVGYIDISEFHEDEEAVYFRGAIDEENRGKSLGKKMLSDVSDYVFSNYIYVKFIKLNIHRDNDMSINIAKANGYQVINDELYSLENPLYVKQKCKL